MIGIIIAVVVSFGVGYIMCGLLSANTTSELLSDNFELQQELGNKDKIIEALHKKYNVNRKI